MTYESEIMAKKGEAVNVSLDGETVIEERGGRYLARTSRVIKLEGERPCPQLVLLLEWPSQELADAFYDSEEYRPYRERRLAGSRSELENYLRTIRVFDVDWMASMSVGVFPLQAGSAADVVENLEQVFGKDGKFVTSRQLRDRLTKELERNVALPLEAAGVAGPQRRTRVAELLDAHVGVGGLELVDHLVAEGLQVRRDGRQGQGASERGEGEVEQIAHHLRHDIGAGGDLRGAQAPRTASQKKTLRAAEQERPEIAAEREAYRQPQEHQGESALPPSRERPQNGHFGGRAEPGNQHRRGCRLPEPLGRRELIDVNPSPCRGCGG